MNPDHDNTATDTAEVQTEDPVEQAICEGDLCALRRWGRALAATNWWAAGSAALHHQTVERKLRESRAEQRATYTALETTLLAILEDPEQAEIEELRDHARRTLKEHRDAVNDTSRATDEALALLGGLRTRPSQHLN